MNNFVNEPPEMPSWFELIVYSILTAACFLGALLLLSELITAILSAPPSVDWANVTSLLEASVMV